MDFRNLCQKIDVDSIRAKIPQLPAMPALPQLKLPKSMPKLKSRKIFRSSREDVNRASTKQKQQKQQQQQQQHQQQYGMQQYPSLQQLQPPIMPADFIDHTPTRISTISSLMHHQGSQEHPQFDGGRGGSTYRSACSINDDDYPSPTTTMQYDRRYRGNSDSNRPDISPLRTSRHSLPKLNSALDDGTNANVKMSLTEKLQKGYKDFSEFKFKHIFAKKTVVRKDNIEVDSYVQRYDEDRLHEQQEQERRDLAIADNYDFKFKISRQNTGHSESVSPSDSPVFGGEKQYEKSALGAHKLGGQSDDESGMETSPPKRGQGNAATRFAARQQKSEENNVQEESDIEYEEAVSRQPLQPIARDCWSTRGNHTPVEAAASPISKDPGKNDAKPTGYKERMRRLTSYISHDESGAESNQEGGASGGAKVLSKLRGFGKRTTEEDIETAGGTKRKAPLTPQQSEEMPDVKSTDKPINTIKHNFRRLQKSMKRQPAASNAAASTADSEDEDTPKKESTKPVTKTGKLTARLRRFKSRDASIDNLDNVETESPINNEGRKSPLRAAITNKLQTWKKSFKKQPTETAARTDDEDDEEQESPTAKPQKRSDTLMNKLKYIRTRKQPNSTEDLDAPTDDEVANAKSKDANTRKSSNLEEKFEQARQRTMKKVNEKMQQMKFFHKSQEHVEKEQDANKNNNRNRNSSDEDENEEEQEYDAQALANVPPTIARRTGGGVHQEHPVYELNSEQDDIEEITNIQHEYATHRTRWTTNPLLNESMESDTDSEFPRVLIHQDNSDLFESTLIIAVTRPSTASPSPKITEIHSEHHTSISNGKPVEWVSNKDIITGFLEVTPPSKRKAAVEAIVVTGGITRGHARKLSMDSNNSDSDSWIPETVRNKQLTSSQESSRRASTAGLISIEENEEPWKVHSIVHEEKLHKSKSIDIFETSVIKGGATAAFEDFDDELKNEPVVKIVGVHQNVDSFEKDSSEDPETADDDNSSRITRILVESIKEEDEEISSKEVTAELEKKEVQLEEVDNQIRQIGNSRESLDANFDENEEMYSDDDEYDEDDRPPSVSPPPPPLPQRQPSIRITKPQTAVVDVAASMVAAPMEAPPLAAPPPPPPATKPPLPPHKPLVLPPKIPERTASMTRIAKPLVKTSSLRLAYNEQVKPADVGKVNKLISRFEQPNSKVTEGRPRLTPRKPVYHDSEDYSDEEDEEEDDEVEYSDEDEDSSDAVYEKDVKNAKVQMERDITPTNQSPPPKTYCLDSPREVKIVVPAKHMTAPAIPTAVVVPVTNVTTKEQIASQLVTTSRQEESRIQIQRSTSNLKSPINIPTIALNLDSNANYSRPSSEYGSPLAYPSSLKGSTETTPIPDRRPQQQLDMRRAERSRRSMTRDNDNFYSFDSDEENSYYSISPSGSSRYVVEI